MDDPSGWEEMLSRTGPPTSVVMVIVPGMTSLSAMILALKYFSYQAAVALGSAALMCTWLIVSCLVRLT